jgi:glycosyltransferase involved in cell wall biosynthesis
MADASFTATPIVSVVMPVYNGEAYLADSIGSILAQTFTEWELICVDDGSHDGSLEVLGRYDRIDPRVHVITRPNSGVTRARNDGIAVARGRYIAAMDSDDVALPERLRRQVDYMESHPECVGLGAAVRIVGPDLMPICDEAKPLDHETIDRLSLLGCGASIRQSVAMFRAEAIRQIGGYRDECFTHEETDLYLRLAEIGRLANLPDFLLLYRQRLGSVNRTQQAVQDQYRRKILRDTRIRRGLPVGPELVDSEEASIQADNGRGSWAHWSHDAFNGGYRSTAQRYAWRAMRSEPLAVSSWKAVLRPYLRSTPSKHKQDDAEYFIYSGR